MVIKKTIRLTLLLLVVGILFAGCSSDNKNSNVKVESDEAKTNASNQNLPTIEQTTNTNQSAIAKTTSTELINSSDNVEIGQLI